MDTQSLTHIGNATLLERHLVAFLAPGRIATLSVMPTLEWATEVARRDDVAVVSGWQSRLEREVLEVLLNGSCGIVLVLARDNYKNIPTIWQKPMAEGRLLIISVCHQQRQNRQTASIRNERVVDMSTEVVMPIEPPVDSMLRPLYESLYHSTTKQLNLLFQR